MIITLFVICLPFLENTWGQVENTMGFETSQNASSINVTQVQSGNEIKDLLQNETERETVKSDKFNSNRLLSLTLNPINCTSTNNPCIGTDEGDSMLGDDDSNTMEGRIGSDEMRGMGSNDIMSGNEGIDQIEGNDGDDILYGGSERDYLIGGKNNDKLEGGDGDDMIYGEDGADNMNGGSGDDTLNGGFGDDSVLGYGGNDQLIGGEGSDTIMGFEGNDVLFHSDALKASPDGSRDTIYCGDGYDEVWLNQEIDHDTAYNNCEVIHTKDDPYVDDPDNDYVSRDFDNCPTVSNNSQMDTDDDKIGDACDPYPEVPSIKESKVTIKFDSITVHNDHDKRSTGEWDLVAYVQGNRVKLADTTSGIVCGGSQENCFYLWYADGGDTYQFDKEAAVTVKMPEKVQLSLYTAGREIDDCNRKPFPEGAPTGVSTATGMVDNGIIANSQKTLNNYAGLCDTNIFGDVQEDDLLGTISEGYIPVPGTITKEVTSTNGDFTLRYTISVVNS